MKLLVDIGNRRLKWATATAAGTLDGRAGVLEYSDPPNDAPADPNGLGGMSGLAAQLAVLDPPTSVWVSCVAAPESGRAVAEYARGAWSLAPVFVTAQKQQAGIVNGYPHAASLGSDRWAALLAAGELFPRQPVIVVDAGTAVTVDLLDGAGLFRGGVIFPGVHAMQFALGAHTENITGAESRAESRVENAACGAAADVAGPVNAVATDTHEAVAAGALLAVAGGINLAVARQWTALQTECRVVATGGDAGRVAPLLATEVSAKIRIEPQLVLQGLAVISRESAR